MGNIASCRSNKYSGEVTEEIDHKRAHKLLSSILIGGLSSGSGSKGDLNETMTALLSILSPHITAQHITHFIFTNPERLNNCLRELTLDHIKQWLLLHPQAFDALMKDMHMESTIKWIQVKHGIHLSLPCCLYILMIRKY